MTAHLDSYVVLLPSDRTHCHYGLTDISLGPPAVGQHEGNPPVSARASIASTISTRTSPTRIWHHEG
jgi:hypothetical protein